MNWDPEEGDHTSINQLPEEIRGLIFNKSPQKEVLEFRTVCKLWSKDIQNLYNFKINLDERSLYFPQVSQLRIVGLEIVELFDVGYQLQSNDPTKPNLPFKHPNLIRELRITPNSKISAQNLQALLRFVSKSVTDLSIHLTQRILSQELETIIPYKFENLEKLQIDLKGDDVVSSTDEEPDNSILFQLVKSVFPKLKSLEWTGDCYRGLPPSFFAILKSLWENPSGSQSLCIRAIMTSQPFATKELGTFKIVSNSKIIGFQLFGTSTTLVPSTINLMTELLTNQENVRFLHLGNFIPVSPDVLESLANNNFSRLGEIIIESVIVRMDLPFDLSIFQDCYNLRRLTLKKFVSGESSSSELINLNRLPPNLSFLLKLVDFKILTTDLKALLDSDLVCGLGVLELINCGSYGEFGVTASIMEGLEALKKKNLSPRKVLISGFNCSDWRNLDSTWLSLRILNSYPWIPYYDLKLVSYYPNHWHILNHGSIVPFIRSRGSVLRMLVFISDTNGQDPFFAFIILGVMISWVFGLQYLFNTFYYGSFFHFLFRVGQYHLNPV